MPSRRSQIMAAEAEERKKRQEKFRKRTRSLYNKTRLLAKDTDAWVALIVRDRAGRVQSFRSSGSLYWPPSIQDLMVSRHFSSSIILPADPGRKTAHPSGAHEFLEKHAISGCWKEVAEDESDMALVDGDAESVDEGDPVISVITVEKETGADSTISVDQCHVGKDVEDAPRDKPNETVAEKLTVDPFGESDNTPLLQLREPDRSLVDAGQLDDAIVDAPWDSGNPRVDSPGKDVALDSGMLDDTIFEFGESDNMTVDTIEESNNTTTDMAVDTTARKPGDSDNVPDVPGEYDMMDVDIPGAKNRAQPDVRGGESIEAANTLYTMSQYHNPPSTGGLGSWQVVNRPKMDPKELLESWNWVFQNRCRQ